MRRRKLLSGIAGSTAVGVAGCLGGDEDDDEAGGDTGDGSGTDPGGEDGTEPGSAESPEIETVSQERLDDAEDDEERHVETEATVTVDADRIEIEGRLEAPTPCHEAIIADVEREGDALTVYVALEESDDEMCTQVISEIEYEATVAFADEAPETVVVVHDDRAGEETAAEYET